jgi:hypothetical protein
VKTELLERSVKPEVKARMERDNHNGAQGKIIKRPKGRFVVRRN